VEHRKAERGTVTVRLRLEFPDVRNVIMSGVTPPPPSTVSVSRRIDFDVAHYTTDGIIDDSKFSIDTLSRYAEELQKYQNIVQYLIDASYVVREITSPLYFLGLFAVINWFPHVCTSF
jgi:hypothetical protein